MATHKQTATFSHGFSCMATECEAGGSRARLVSAGDIGTKACTCANPASTRRNLKAARGCVCESVPVTVCIRVCVRSESNVKRVCASSFSEFQQLILEGDNKPVSEISQCHFQFACLSRDDGSTHYIRFVQQQIVAAVLAPVAVCHYCSKMIKIRPAGTYTRPIRDHFDASPRVCACVCVYPS